MTKTRHSPCFQFYPADFIGSAKVSLMTAEEIGAYFLLLMLDWQGNGFAFNETRLAKWCRLTPIEFTLAWEGVLKECFVEHDGRWWNPRLEVERNKQTDWREKSSRGGKVSASRPRDNQGRYQPPATSPANYPATPRPKAKQPPKQATSQGPALQLTVNSLQSQDQKRTTPAVAGDAFPKELSDRFYDAWVKHRGEVNYGHLRKALTPVFTGTGSRYTADEVEAAIQVFGEGADALGPEKARFWTVQSFAADLPRWVRLGALPNIDETGEPTERGRLTVFGVST